VLFAAYMSSPCHIELILSEKEEAVRKEVFLFALYGLFNCFGMILVYLNNFSFFVIFPA
jgi:hypothetical protein